MDGAENPGDQIGIGGIAFERLQVGGGLLSKLASFEQELVSQFIHQRLVSAR